MLKVKRLLIYLLFFFLFIIPLKAESKILYMDIEFILSNSNKGKELLKNLNDNENIKIKNLNEKEQILKNKENKILSSKNLISDEQFQKDVENFRNELNEYNNFKQLEIEKLKEIRKEKINNLLGLINTIIENYMNDNSISMIIDKKNIYMANKKYDITDKLIVLINKNIN